MDAVGVTVLSERERLGEVGSTLIVGPLSDEARGQLPGRLTSLSLAEMLAQEPADVTRHELVIQVGDGSGSPMQRRALGHAIARVAERAVIAVHTLGAEVPVPLVEVKRGVVLDDPSLAYRVYVNREAQL